MSSQPTRAKGVAGGARGKGEHESVKRAQLHGRERQRSQAGPTRWLRLALKAERQVMGLEDARCCSIAIVRAAESIKADVRRITDLDSTENLSSRGFDLLWSAERGTRGDEVGLKRQTRRLSGPIIAPLHL